MHFVEWDGAAWTLRANDGPSPRSTHATTYDSARGVTVLFGGVGKNDFSEAEIWELQPTPAGCGPMDLNADGDVDCADWLILRDRWVTGEPPSFGRCPRATAIALLPGE